MTFYLLKSFPVSPSIPPIHLIVPSNITQFLNSHQNGLSYTTSLTFGEQNVTADLVYDTGSGVLTVSHV